MSRNTNHSFGCRLKGGISGYGWKLLINGSRDNATIDAKSHINTELYYLSGRMNIFAEYRHLSSTVHISNRVNRDTIQQIQE